MSQEVNFTETHTQALIYAIEFLESKGRFMTARDLADLLRRMGGPNLDHDWLQARHEGLA